MELFYLATFTPKCEYKYHSSNGLHFDKKKKNTKTKSGNFWTKQKTTTI